ncbi:MAG: hypothetical protein IT445_16985 [Phycisphaeraceae bacterium]|nr:hypothetical protein [Phycisphaeraceae bacterium]
MWLILLILTLTTVVEPYVAACGRSPIPQPGENIRKPLPFTRLAPEEAPPTAPAQPHSAAIPWTEAHLHVNQTVTVEGVVVDTHRVSSLTFLNFDKNWQDKFYVVVFTSAHPSSFQPEIAYLNKKLRITGKVVLHKDRPQLQVHQLNQIEVVP